MRRALLLFPLFPLFLFLFSACGPRLSPLTQRLIDEQDWQDRELERIQFYLSEDLVLTREFRSGNTRISNGQVKVVNGRELEQMVFPKNTPGVFVFSPRQQRVAVSFDGDDENYLVFGPNPKAGQRYTLLASEWDRQAGKVTYGGRTWRVRAEDAYASLMIPLKKLRNSEVKGRVARGRRLK